MFVVIMVRRKRKVKLCLASRLRRSIINGKLDTSQVAKAKKPYLDWWTRPQLFQFRGRGWLFVLRPGYGAAPRLEIRPVTGHIFFQLFLIFFSGFYFSVYSFIICKKLGYDKFNLFIYTSSLFFCDGFYLLIRFFL